MSDAVGALLVGVAAGSAGLSAALLLPPARAGGGAGGGYPCDLRRPGHPGERAGPAPARSGGPAAAPVRALVGGTAGLGAMVLVGGVVGACLGLLTAAAVWRTLGSLEPPAARRRREALARGLPHAVDLMASSLAVGTAPGRALELVAAAVDPPMRDELAVLGSRLALGVDPARVWTEVGRHPQLGPLGRSMLRAVDSGASVTDALHRLAEDLRRQARADVETRARAVGVRAAVPLGLCLLPAFLLTGIVPLIAGSVALLTGR